MKNRNQKKRDKEKWQERRRLATKKRLEHALTALGLLKGFQELPAWVRERVLQMLPADPVVDIEPGANGCPDTQLLKEALEQALEERSLQTDDGALVSMADVISVFLALPAGFSSLAAASMIPQKHKRFLHEAEAKASTFREKELGRIEDTLSVEIQTTLLRHSRIDQGIHGCTVKSETTRTGKPVFRITLVRSEPRESRVEIDGKVRPVFQCGLPDWTDGILWMEADGEQFGLGRGRKIPVCIQSHALRKLKERFPADRDVELATQYGLLASLYSPEVVERQEDAYLIAYHVNSLRLGYLVAKVAQERIVITTFLFLTMAGTPEARLLWEQLRLCRRDIEHSGLDRLETFLSPDVLRDQVLVNVLEDCGCGSLLELARKGFPYHPLTNRAEELKRFLQLTDGGDRKLSRRGRSFLPRVG